ncbi:hypothetical protein VP501E541_P0229 [Vibrio phage 501E54-1]|nr:hypothetical protein VP501E541_P0229 [Vibrio phage 501E54-1]
MPNLEVTLSFNEYYDCSVTEIVELPDNWNTLSEERQCDIIDAEIAELESHYFKSNWEVTND